MTTEHTVAAVDGSAPRSLCELDLPPAVLRFRDAARRQFGDRLEHIVLYGSRARGDHRPDSDYDIAIFVSDLDNAYTEYKPLAALAMHTLAVDDIEINAALHPASAWRGRATPLMRAIRQEGLEL